MKFFLHFDLDLNTNNSYHFVRNNIARFLLKLFQLSVLLQALVYIISKPWHNYNRTVLLNPNEFLRAVGCLITMSSKI